MVAVSGNDPVALFEDIEEANGYRLFTGVDVQVPADLALPEALLAGLLEGTHQHHVPVKIRESVRARGYRTFLLGILSLYLTVPGVLVFFTHGITPSLLQIRACKQNNRLEHSIDKPYCSHQPFP